MIKLQSRHSITRKEHARLQTSFKIFDGKATHLKGTTLVRIISFLVKLPKSLIFSRRKKKDSRVHTISHPT